MRRTVDVLIVLMLTIVLGTLLLYHWQNYQRLQQVRQTHQALADLHEQATYHGLLEGQLSKQGHFPRQIDPAWFGERLPANPLLASDTPWLDLAPEGDSSVHPPNPVVHPHTTASAAFWYNPARGVFSARVPVQDSPQASLELYNQINGTQLTALPADTGAARQPVPLVRVDHAAPDAPKARPTLADLP